MVSRRPNNDEESTNSFTSIINSNTQSTEDDMPTNFFTSKRGPKFAYDETSLSCFKSMTDSKKAYDKDIAKMMKRKNTTSKEKVLAKVQIPDEKQHSKTKTSKKKVKSREVREPSKSRTPKSPRVKVSVTPRKSSNKTSKRNRGQHGLTTQSKPYDPFDTKSPDSDEETSSLVSDRNLNSF